MGADNNRKVNAALCCERAVPTLLTCQARAAAGYFATQLIKGRAVTNV